jgi:hypothetical protein
MLASGEKHSQVISGLGSEFCLAEPDSVKAKRKCAIADLVLGWSRRLVQDGTWGWPSAE